MDPQGGGPTPVQLNNTAAQLLAKLCVDLETEDASGVIARALGVLEMCVRAKRGGGRLCFVNERGETSDVVF